MALAKNINSKTAFREDLRTVRSILREIEYRLTERPVDWDYIETCARDIESLGSSIACRATENID